jgi:hypothetical protein
MNRACVQPDWSQVTLERTAQRFRLILPAVGLGRHRKEAPWLPAQSLFWVGAVLCFFVVLLTVFFFALPQLVAHNAADGKPVMHAPNDLVVPWPVWVGLAGFWGIVVAGILGGLNLCRRRGVVDVTDGVLQVEPACLAAANGSGRATRSRLSKPVRRALPLEAGPATRALPL